MVNAPISRLVEGPKALKVLEPHRYGLLHFPLQTTRPPALNVFIRFPWFVRLRLCFGNQGQPDQASRRVRDLTFWASKRGTPPHLLKKLKNKPIALLVPHIRKIL